MLILSPKRVVEVGVECFIRAIATEECYDVPPRESTTASKSKYGRQLFGKSPERETLKIRIIIQTLISSNKLDTSDAEKNWMGSYNFLVHLAQPKNNFMRQVIKYNPRSFEKVFASLEIGSH